MKKYENKAKIIAENNWNELSRAQREEVSKMLEHMDDICDVNQEYVHHRTRGQKAEDDIAKVAGS